MLYDKDIREPLFDFLEEKYGKIRIIEEKKMGRSRADVVMVLPDSLCGLEIKSDADTYARLNRQVNAPVKIQGETRVKSITLRSGAVEEVDGVFCLRNANN